MKIIRNALAAGLLVGASVAACSSQHGATAGNDIHVNTPANNGGAIGSLKMAWTLPPNGYSVTALNWTLTGSAPQTAGDNYSGVANIGGASSAEFVAGGINAGCGYTLNVTATDSNSDPCSGTATGVCVSAGIVSYVQISVTCLTPNAAVDAGNLDTGSLAVEAGIVETQVPAWSCPQIPSFSINPAEVMGSQTAAVAITSTVALSGTPGKGINALWTNGPCTAAAGLAGTGTPGGFINPTTMAPDNSDLSVAFNCGTCVGQVAITGQVENFQQQPNTSTYTDVCLGQSFTSYTGLINCEGGGMFQCLNASFPTICGAAPNQYCANLTNGTVQGSGAVTNCGVCGGTCAAPTTACSNSACACPVAGQVAVGPAGAQICCNAGQIDSNGICCASGQTGCGGACVNTTSDVNNCGGCGMKCAAGQNCSNSACVTPLTVCLAPATCNPATQITCGNQATGACTATEAYFVGLDNPTVPGPDTGSCLSCLDNNGCIDDANAGSVAKECDDLSGTFAPGAGTTAGTTTSKPQACLNTLACMTNATVGMHCASNAGGDTFCYCGVEGFTPTAAACSGAGGAVNGSCQVPEQNGFTFATTDSLHIINNYLDHTGANPSGVANQILNCAKINHCTSCL